jgi:hypothetical protein
LVFAVAGVLVLTAGFYLVFFYHWNSKVKWSNKVEPVATTTVAVVYYSQLDGMPVTDASKQVPNTVGVMIDNHPDAYPQSGLVDARVVYEAPVEGGITRYMAIFDASQTSTKAGPVRSARPYYLDWIREYCTAGDRRTRWRF